MERRRVEFEETPRHRRGASSRPWFCCLVATLVVASAFLTPAVGSAADGAEQQVEFGADMARRGLWKEALFRFQQADRLDPDNPRILNNIAVSYEALGLFERALETYRKALRLAQQNDTLRANYSRFVEFYQNFRPREESEELAAEETETPNATDEEDVNG